MKNGKYENEDKQTTFDKFVIYHLLFII